MSERGALRAMEVTKSRYRHGLDNDRFVGWMDGRGVISGAWIGDGTDSGALDVGAGRFVSLTYSSMSSALERSLLDCYGHGIYQVYIG